MTTAATALPLLGLWITAQFHWGQRANFSVAKWAMDLAVFFDGELVGSQGFGARDFLIHLDAELIKSSAFTENPASLAASRKCGYSENGMSIIRRIDEPATLQLLLPEPGNLIRYGRSNPHLVFAVRGSGYVQQFRARQEREVFKQTAPVIKLPESASENDHLTLLDALNSSAACFWLREATHDKGNRGEGGGITSAAWGRFRHYNSTRIKDLSLPAGLLLDFGRELDALGQQLAATSTREEDGRIRTRIIALQEELD